MGPLQHQQEKRLQQVSPVLTFKKFTFRLNLEGYYRGERVRECLDSSSLFWTLKLLLSSRALNPGPGGRCSHPRSFRRQWVRAAYHWMEPRASYSSLTANSTEAVVCSDANPSRGTAHPFQSAAMTTQHIIYLRP